MGRESGSQPPFSEGQWIEDQRRTNLAGPIKGRVVRTTSSSLTVWWENGTKSSHSWLHCMARFRAVEGRR